MTDQPQPGASLSVADLPLLKAGDWLMPVHWPHQDKSPVLFDHLDSQSLLVLVGRPDESFFEHRFTFLGRPIDADGWIEHRASDNPPPDDLFLEYITGSGLKSARMRAVELRWDRDFKWRPHVPPPASNGGTDHKGEGREAVEQACGLTETDALRQPMEALAILRGLSSAQSLFVWADGTYRVAPTLDTAIAQQEDGTLLVVIPMAELTPDKGPPAPWVKAANAALEAYEKDYGDRLDDMHELGRIEDSRGSPSFRIRVGHIRALRTHGEPRAPVPPAGRLEQACAGLADDYMTSETHHPGHVLIPTAKFDAILAAIEGSPFPPAGEVETVLPYDVTINHITYKKGVSLSILVDAATRWHSALRTHGEPCAPVPQSVEGATEAARKALEVIAAASESSETKFGSKMSDMTRVFQSISRVSREALAALSAAPATGGVVVPEEPTPEMIKAGGRAVGWNPAPDFKATHIYRAMLAARPGSDAAKGGA